MALRRVTLFFVVLLLLSISSPSVQVAATAQTLEPTDSRPAPQTKDPTSTYFPETGHYVGYSFLNYWQTHGGLAQFGLPLTEGFEERNPADGKTYTVQYFERARFEFHPEKTGTPYEVELGLLGKQAIAGRQFEGVPPFASTPQRYYFPETGYSLGGAFKRYWDSRGGLAIYGYPLSEEIIESGYIVQYFERARFEFHPENAGTPFEVLLSLLGAATLEQQGHRLSQAFRVQVEPDTVVQGRTIQLIVVGANGSPAISRLGDKPLALVGAGGNLTALAPIESTAPLQSQPLVTEITDNTGIVRRFEQRIGVRAGAFDSQFLYVEINYDNETARREQSRVDSFFAQVTPEKLWDGKFSWPAFGPITTAFGTRRTYSGSRTGNSIHDGVDLAVPANTPVRATARGRVVLSEFQTVRGNLVILDHGLGVHSAYFHHARNLVKVGDTVNQGDIIGLAGTSGLSTGVHLHWEVRIGPVGVDPLEWLNRKF